mmetsp:Transcript_60015/g.71430  ORF Transcript_60015/g.71430 Transcript_60015/m.71430 type:complete len:102 (-) Transcript_60015:231-536(-)
MSPFIICQTQPYLLSGLWREGKNQEFDSDGLYSDASRKPGIDKPVVCAPYLQSYPQPLSNPSYALPHPLIQARVRQSITTGKMKFSTLRACYDIHFEGDGV